MEKNYIIYADYILMRDSSHDLMLGFEVSYWDSGVMDDLFYCEDLRGICVCFVDGTETTCADYFSDCVPGGLALKDEEEVRRHCYYEL